MVIFVPPNALFCFRMTNQAFFSRLAGITAGTSALLTLLYRVAPPIQPHGLFATATVGLFVLVCTGLFFAGRSAARSSSKLAFNNIVSASVFGKMLLAVALLFVYQQVTKPSNEWFVGIFLLIYVVYTAFEVWFMTKLAKT